MSPVRITGKVTRSRTGRHNRDRAKMRGWRWQKGGILKRIYVAGPYSANNVLDVLKNIGRGEKMCAKLFSMGYAPFCPWHDKSYVTDMPDSDFAVDQFYQYSLAWLEVSDAILLLPGWETSKGTIKEIERADELGIPVFKSIDELPPP